MEVFSEVELHYRDLFHGKIYEVLLNLTSGIKWRMMNEKRNFFGGYSSEKFCCLWLFQFLRSNYTRMSGLIHVLSTDMNDAGKTRLGGHFFRKEFLPNVCLNSLGKWVYHTGNHFWASLLFHGLSWNYLYYTENIKKTVI